MRRGAIGVLALLCAADAAAFLAASFALARWLFVEAGPGIVAGTIVVLVALAFDLRAAGPPLRWFRRTTLVLFVLLGAAALLFPYWIAVTWPPLGVGAVNTAWAMWLLHREGHSPRFDFR